MTLLFLLVNYWAASYMDWKKTERKSHLPPPLSKVATSENERAILVDVYMPSIRLAQVNRSVNRTVTLPAWLNAAALERNVNFSQVLQDALKEKFHLG